ALLAGTSGHKRQIARPARPPSRSWRRTDRGAEPIVAPSRSWRRADRGAEPIVAQNRSWSASRAATVAAVIGGASLPQAELVSECCVKVAGRPRIRLLRLYGASRAR